MTKRLLIVLALSIAVSIPASAMKPIGPDNGIAIAQTSGSTPAGWAAVLIGRGIFAGPRYQQWNLVTVETGPYRYQWEEVKDKNRLIFVINEQFQFWRSGKWFLVVGQDGKTHKFALVSALRKPAAPAK